MTLEEKLNYVLETKNLIRAALIAKGIDIPTDMPFRDYVAKIETLVPGGQNEVT